MSAAHLPALLRHAFAQHKPKPLPKSQTRGLKQRQFRCWTMEESAEAVSYRSCTYACANPDALPIVITTMNWPKGDAVLGAR
jgi:hypothetical protein